MTNQVKPGDTILVIRSKHRKKEYTKSQHLWKTFKVAQVNDSYMSKEKKRFIIRENNSQFSVGYLYLYNDEFVIVEPSTVMPNPGDKIIITRPLSVKYPSLDHLGKTCTYKNRTESLNTIRTWVEDEQGNNFWLHRKNYEILNRTNAPTPTLSSCSDCHGTGQIQLFTSIRKCKCQDA